MDKNQKIENLHKILRYWQTETAFFNDEIRFFLDLIDRYFSKLLKDEGLDNLQRLADEMTIVMNELKKVDQDLKARLKEVDEGILQPDQMDSRSIEQHFKELQKQIKKLENDFRNLKRDLFTLTDEMLEIEKIKHKLPPH